MKLACLKNKYAARGVSPLAAGLVLLFSIITVSAQSSSNSESLIPGREPDNQPRSVKEFLAKQKAEKSKKEHEELLKRGDEVVTLTDQLETAFERGSELTAGEREKLESLEKIVTRIRKSLGGDDDDEDREEAEAAAPAAAAEKRPGTLKEAFLDLKEMTSKLVDELKKTSRFTVSALAIQTSNSVLKIVRFLRLRK